MFVVRSSCLKSLRLVIAGNVTCRNTLTFAAAALLVFLVLTTRPARMRTLTLSVKVSRTFVQWYCNNLKIILILYVIILLVAHRAVIIFTQISLYNVYKNMAIALSIDSVSSSKEH